MAQLRVYSVTGLALPSAKSVLTRPALSTAAIHSHPVKAKAAYTVTPTAAEGKATSSVMCGWAHSLYSQGSFQEPCCMKTPPTEGPL